MLSEQEEKAYDNTYGRGINAEAVGEMYMVLQSIRRQDFEIDDLTKYSIAIVLDKAQLNKPTYIVRDAEDNPPEL